MCDANQNLQWLPAHDPCDIDNISDRGIAAIELYEYVCRVGRQYSHGRNWNGQRLPKSPARRLETYLL